VETIAEKGKRGLNCVYNDVESQQGVIMKAGRVGMSTAWRRV
jgi:hypothetical protein